jgi:signal-transduction protein with cAMP-binding, CBS, and nucleotidyltransferase domain
MSENIEATRTKDKLLISIPTKNMKAEEIDDFLSFFKAEFAVRSNKMTAERAEETSEEIKTA